MYRRYYECSRSSDRICEFIRYVMIVVVCDEDVCKRIWQSADRITTSRSRTGRQQETEHTYEVCRVVGYMHIMLSQTSCWPCVVFLCMLHNSSPDCLVWLMPCLSIYFNTSYRPSQYCFLKKGMGVRREERTHYSSNLHLPPVTNTRVRMPCISRLYRSWGPRVSCPVGCGSTIRLDIDA